MERKRNFFNGWDLKSLITIGTLIFSIGYNHANFDNLKTNFNDFKQDTKETLKDLYNKLGAKADKTESGGNTTIKGEQK